MKSISRYIRSSLRSLCIGLAPAVFMMPSVAAPEADYLPTEADVTTAILEHPNVQIALNLVKAAEASRRGLIAGNHEFELSTTAQRRNVIDEGRYYNEWEAQISRPIRLPGKSDLDRSIGDSTLKVAHLKLNDAEHTAARNLLDLWMSWIKTTAQANLLSAQHKLLARERDTVVKRVQKGDASQRELDIIQAEFATLTSTVLAATSAADQSRQLLVGEFPTLVIPDSPPVLPKPVPLPGGTKTWQDRIVQQSAELAIAKSESTRQSQVAARSRADRTPDPTVGLRLMSERGGAEKVVGVVVSIPFGGEYRRAEAERETANASAAMVELNRMQRAIMQTAWVRVQTATTTYDLWKARELALEAQKAASSKTRRAWELGEAALAEYLLATRNLRQAQLEEASARVDATQAALMVRIDAHEMWHSRLSHTETD